MLIFLFLLSFNYIIITLISVADVRASRVPQDLCLFEMESMAVIAHSSGLPGGRLDVFGDLDLVQKTPLVCSSKKPVRMNKPILSFDSSDWLVNIYEEYSKRTGKFCEFFTFKRDDVHAAVIYVYVFFFSFYEIR